MQREISLIGAAIDACCNIRGSFEVPQRLQLLFKEHQLNFDMVFEYTGSGKDINNLATYYRKIADYINNALNKDLLPIVIGGDHSCAIGTWSGVYNYLNSNNQSYGLIWVDAHMDAHTPETTLSGNIHGMPVATLLGYGYKDFIHLLNSNPKLEPENVVLIGVRSYEEYELKLLNRLGVKVYYNYDVVEYGLKSILTKEWGRLLMKVDKIGLSIDLDGFDPSFTPGVSTPEKFGINFQEFLVFLGNLDINQLIGIEIVEGNPLVDKTNKTMNCVLDIVLKLNHSERRFVIEA